jgi:hypothetical protein
MGKREYREEVRRMNNRCNRNNETRQRAIMETLFSNAGKVLFGVASVELKIHEGRCVAVTYSTTENTRQREAGEQLNVQTPI